MLRLLNERGTIRPCDNNGRFAFPAVTLSQSCKLAGDARMRPDEVGMMLYPTTRSRNRARREWVGLPYTQSREAEEEMLARLPGRVFKVEVHADTAVLVVADVLDACCCSLETEE